VPEEANARVEMGPLYAIYTDSAILARFKLKIKLISVFFFRPEPQTEKIIRKIFSRNNFSADMLGGHFLTSTKNSSQVVYNPLLCSWNSNTWNPQFSRIF
jgi:hypothetical protein